MDSLGEFVLVAIVVTITPGPGTATIVRVATRHGKRAAMSAIIGNCVGVLVWGVLSALGVSSLILASAVAYDLLRIGGATVLVVLGLRSLMARDANLQEHQNDDVRTRAGWRAGLVTSLSNPKLAVFFVALFPQFLSRGAPVLPYALGMAAVIVVFDVIWYSTLAYAVDRTRAVLQPRVQRRMEKLTGAIVVGLGARLAAEHR